MILDRLETRIRSQGDFLIEQDIVEECWSSTDQMMGDNGSIHLMELAFNLRKLAVPFDSQVLSDIRNLVMNGYTLQSACVIAEVVCLGDKIVM